MKLGHLSDLHILAVEYDDLDPWRFLNKRLVGGANLLMNRSHSHSVDVVREAIRHLEEHEVDHIAVTGDLSNLALDSEFRTVANLLGEIDDHATRVSVVPGNHDYYVPEIAESRTFERHFAPYVQSDLPNYQLDSGYPSCKLLDEVAVVGMNSGIATPTFFATGEVLPDEVEATRALLDDPAVQERFTVVMIHHHLVPFEHSRVEYTRRLVNGDEILRLMREQCVDLVIHGHNHHFATIELPHLGGPGTLRVCEAGSSSTPNYTDPKFGGKYNIYHIEDRQLRKVETHLYEGDRLGFVHWRERTFEKSL